MKRKNKKILFLVSEAVLAGTSVFGMTVVLFDLMPDFPRYVIIICALSRKNLAQILGLICNILTMRQ